MIKCGTGILFQDPRSEARRLVRSQVTEVDARSFRVRFASEALPVSPGDELIAYFEDGDEFMQQVVEVGGVEGGAEGLVSLLPSGDAISAETRRHYRVGTISAGVRAAIADEPDCVVQDVSDFGLGVVATGHYDVGSSVPVMLEHAGDVFSGQVRVKSRVELRPGWQRYGLELIDDGSDLCDGLRQIDVASRRPHATKTV